MGNKGINLVRAKNEHYTYDPDFGNGRVCVCGHFYYQHFGSLSDNEKDSKFCADVNDNHEIEVVECGECKCKTFTEKEKTFNEVFESEEHYNPNYPPDMVQEIEEGRLISNFIGLNVRYEQCNAYDDPIEFEMVIDNPDFLDHDEELLYLYETDGPVELNYKFHSDWNWLMGVVIKIENLKDEDKCYRFSFDMGRDFCAIRTNDLEREMIVVGSVYNDKIGSVYQTVIKFIKWYNKIGE